MKRKHYLLAILAVFLLGNGLSWVSAENLDRVTMELSTKEVKRGNRLNMRSYDIIFDYMLKNGDITQEELDKNKAKRKLHRAELKLLKSQGDFKAFKTRLSEIKKEHKAERKKIKEYLKKHDDLKQLLKEERKEHRFNFKDEKPGFHKGHRPEGPEAPGGRENFK